ncbi:uncharacterized protein LOC125706416 [Brienomyrus brachyistius]|uniref:uncharacterized protein LOC125706416 n=1 Tax=Brienomyrus brachyistius TaxID=42636 RepID=UPI0020B3CBDE|nr:uncharacterized protein LOC125706416 [Brienomyrus brachyistius]
MAVQGFLISGDAWKAGERCFQKWRNMERTYKDYVLARRKTDAGRRKQPEFFEQFHALMGQRLSSKLATVATSSLPLGDTSESSITDGSPTPSTPLYTIVVPASSSITVGIPSNTGSEAENCVQAGTTETRLGRKWTKDRVPQPKLLQSHGQKDSEAEQRVQKAKRRSLLGESKAVENGMVLPVWSDRKVSNQDMEATEALVQLYGSPEIQGLIKENKTRTKKIFEIIASRMEEQGFTIGDGPKRAGERCFQKWRNLLRAYKEYVSHPMRPDTAKRRPPPCFEQLHSLVGHRVGLQLPAANDFPTPDGADDAEVEGACQPMLNIVEVPDSPLNRVSPPSATSFHTGEGFTRGQKRRRLSDVAMLLQEYREDARRRERERDKKTEENFQQLLCILHQQHTERMTMMRDLINAVKKT